MKKKNKGKNRKRKIAEDFGTVSFYCVHCDYHFEVEWETIWHIQECTHGYVGYDLNDTFISCDRCNRLINSETNFESDMLTPVTIEDDDIPF
jgi:Fe2+ or Zn2+ uptake regulation protein